MTKRFSSDDHSREAFQSREAQRQEYVRTNTQPPAALLNQLSADADAAMARAKAAHGES